MPNPLLWLTEWRDASRVQREIAALFAAQRSNLHFTASPDDWRVLADMRDAAQLLETALPEELAEIRYNNHHITYRLHGGASARFWLVDVKKTSSPPWPSLKEALQAARIEDGVIVRHHPPQQEAITALLEGTSPASRMIGLVSDKGFFLWRSPSANSL